MQGGDPEVLILFGVVCEFPMFRRYHLENDNEILMEGCTLAHLSDFFLRKVIKSVEASRRTPC